MLMLQGHLDESREETERAAALLRARGDQIMLSQADEVRAELALLNGDVREGIRLHQASYEGKTSTGDRGFASTTAVNVALALIRAEEWDEAARFATIAFETSSFDDIASQAGGKVALARVLAHRGEQGTAETLANEAVGIMEATDYLDWHGDIRVQRAHILAEGGKRDEALEDLEQARELYTRKEAPVRVAEVDRLMALWSV
jgi:tetratricopeptide (TPR) repeat protein